MHFINSISFVIA